MVWNTIRHLRSEPLGIKGGASSDMSCVWLQQDDGMGRRPFNDVYHLRSTAKADEESLGTKPGVGASGV